MDVKKLILGMVGIMICAVMIGGALLPAVGSAIDDQREIINNDFVYYRTGSVNDNVLIHAEKSTTGFTVNGTSTNVPTGVASQIITSDSLVFIMNQNKSNFSVYVLENGNSVTYSPDIVDLTVSGTKITGTVTSGSETVNIDLDVTWSFVYSLEQTNWVQYNAYGQRTLKMNDVSQIYGANWINITSQFYSFNGTNLKVNGVTNNSMVINPVNVDGYVDYITVSFSETGDNLSFVVDNDGSDYTVHPFYAICPKSIVVTSETNAPIVAMFNAIPLIAIAGLVMAGIYVFISRK